MASFRTLLPVILIVGLAYPTRVLTISPLQTADTIATSGYPSEIHHATTSDGYILEMHRIPHGRDQTPSTDRPAVFLMHGLYSASNSFIAMGPEYAPAYNLADAGFDVWMGNARGNLNSRFHSTLSPDSTEEKFDFFDFSFEDIGMYDLPAMIEYVLEYTGQEKLHYIGHSQGGTVFLVLMSMKPEYNEKIASAHLLAGVGYQDYFPNQQLSAIARFTDIIYSTARTLGIVEVSLSTGENRPESDDSDDSCPEFEDSFMCELTGMRELMRDDATISYSIGLGGGSLKQLAHYGQNIRDKRFRRWSYGTLQNMGVYGSTGPPLFDLSLITANVTMHYTVSDNLLDERDVLAMANDMPYTSVRKVARESFLHADFVLAEDAKELVTDYIIEAIRESSGIVMNPELTEEEDIIEEVITPVEANPEPAVADSAHTSALCTIFKMYLFLLVVYKYI